MIRFIQKLKELNITLLEEGYDKKHLCQNEYGKILISPKGLYKGHLPSLKSALNKTVN